MRVLSLYCGAGLLDVGLEQVGIKTTLAIDHWSDACKTFKANHPDCEVVCSKVHDMKGSLGYFDIVVGGPPCPEFSRAKTNRSLNPCEVNHFWDIVDNIAKPKYHLMENVPDVIKVIKSRPNYLVNCADYGTPQTRVRRFFTNLKIPKPTHAKNPTSDLFGNGLHGWVSVRTALGLRATDKKLYISSFGHSKQNRDNITRSIDAPSDTVVVANGLRITDFEIKSQKKIKYRKKQSGYEQKLGNVELAALQGFPKSYEFFGSVSSVKKQIGNAVPPHPIKAFFSQIVIPISLTPSTQGDRQA